MKARSIVAYFTTEDGEKISFDAPMIANSREDAPEKRTFHEKFTLKSREYKYGDKYIILYWQMLMTRRISCSSMSL